MRFFFELRCPFGARLGHQQLDVLSHQGLKLRIARQGFLHGGHFLGADVQGVVFAVQMVLELVVRPGFAWSVLKVVGGKFAPFQMRDLGEGGENLSGRR